MPIDILDYIYALLHSPTYRERYKEFLKIDLPRVPYPKDQKIFWQLVRLGSKLAPFEGLAIATYSKDGDNIIHPENRKKRF